MRFASRKHFFVNESRISKEKFKTKNQPRKFHLEEHIKDLLYFKNKKV